jgi:hypothetical protein
MKLNKCVYYLYLIFIIMLILSVKFNFIFKGLIISFSIPISLLVISLLGIRTHTMNKVKDKADSSKFLIVISSITLVLSLIWIIIYLLFSSFFILLFNQ